MKNYVTTIFVAMIACSMFFATSCTKPSASFTVSPSTAKVGDPITFTNTSTDDRAVMWDFGDGTGSTSPEKTISHIYQQPGTYNVSLTATNKSGKKTSDAPTMQVIITSGIIANFKISDSIPPANSVVTFTSTSTDAQEYNWDFGDGSVILSNGPVETHTYSMGGTYGVTLTIFADNHALSGTITKKIIVCGEAGNIGNLAKIIGTWKYCSRVITDVRNGTPFTSYNAGFTNGGYQLNSAAATNAYHPRQTHQFNTSTTNIFGGNILITDSLGNYLSTGTFSLMDSTRMTYAGDSYYPDFATAYQENYDYANYTVTANSLIIYWVSTNPSLPAYTDYSPATPVAHNAGEVQVVTTTYTYSKK
jgi:PKD repeat protein